MASSCPLLAALAAVVVLSAAAAHARDLSVDDYCQNASYKELCRELLPNSGPIKSGLDAEITLVERAIDKVAECMVAAKAVAGGDGARRSITNECMANYKDAIEDLKAALGYLRGKGTDEDVNVSLSSALTDIDSCNTAWGMAGLGGANPLGQLNGVMIRMLSNTLSLGNELKDMDD